MVSGISDATGVSTTSSASTSSGATSTGGDYLTFLRMLTTQVQNQDPLNPMESTDFAVQLATFSGVEQQVRTNDLLSELVTGSTGGQLGQLAGWIGREVRTTGGVWYAGEALTLQIDPEAGADAVNLVTLDASGREVAREAIGTGAGEVDWIGTDASSGPLPEGLYQFRLESLKAGEVIGLSDVPAYSRVTGAELSQSGPVLILQGGGAVLAAEVTGIRE